jgi:hypothetical protein
MTNKHLLAATFVVVGLSCAFAQEQPILKTDAISVAIKRAKWELQQVVEPKTGKIPINRLEAAYDKSEVSRNRAIQARSISNCDNPNWIEIGPTSFANLSAAGRVRSVCILPSATANKRAFIGGVTGGLWQTDNINSNGPIWQKVNDYFQNLNVTSIAYQPNPANPNNITTLYFGTGEDWENGTLITNPQEYPDYNRGAGIWKSTDGGTTWNQLVNTQNNNFRFVQKIVVTSPTVANPNGIIYAGTYNGIFKSTDGGATWTSIGLPNSTVGRDEVSDIEIAADGTTLFVSLGIARHNGIWRYTTMGLWEKIGGINTPAGRGVGLPASTDAQFRRCDLAIAPNDATGNILYAAIEYTNTTVIPNVNSARIYRTKDRGLNWQQVTVPFNTEQTEYSMALTIAPNDNKIIYFGNDTYLRRGIVTLNAAGNIQSVAWTALAGHNGEGGLPNVHADYHQIVFQSGSNDIAYFCNDGGIYRSANTASANPIFAAINNNLRITQFYTCAMSSTASSFVTMGGTQDNSTREMYSSCLTTSIDHYDDMGDGGFCFINPANDQERIASAWGSFYYRTLDGGATYALLAGADDTGQFINPADCSIVGGQVNLFAATTNGLNRWSNVFGGGGKTTLNNPIFNQTPSAVKVSPNISSIVYVGVPGIGVNARIIKMTNANGVPNYSDITSNIAQAGYISCIEIRKNAVGTDNEIIVTFSNYGTTSVWYTNTGNNAVPNWIPIDNTSNPGALPDMPVRWAIFAPTDLVANPYLHKILLATEVGVWGTTNINTANGPTTAWQSINNGALPNVRTQMLRIRGSDNMILAATYGRGMWRSDMYSPIKVNFSRNTPNPDPNNNCPTVNFISCTTGAVSYAWDLQNDGITDSNLQSVATNCYYRQQKLTINGNACVVKENLTTGYSCANACVYGNPVDQRPVSTINTDLSESVILIYPNPNTGIFTIQSTQKIQNVCMTDITGRVILDIKNPENTVNLSDYPAGVYICTIMTENDVRSAHKIIKE